MHSSRMRTGRTLTVFQKLETLLPPGPDPPPKFGADTTPPSQKFGADTPRKFGADTPPKIWSRPPQKFGADTPPVDRMTHASENITLAKTSFRPVNIYYFEYKKYISNLCYQQ